MPFRLSAHFNGILLLKGNADLRLCPSCNNPTNKWAINVDSPQKPKSDFSISADGYHMVSAKFYKMYHAAKLFGLKFTSLSSGFHMILPSRSVEIDLVHERITKLKFCEICSQYEEILVGQAHPRLATGERDLADREFARSSLDYSHKTMKSFYLYAGDAVRKAMVNAEITGAAVNRMSDQQASGA